ncbi:unnamed protein product [Brugia timori]|uniref:Uncharacterized protein n=1 Tax=Brugia timori TaxID=42155 RepID=A0A3P7TN30_9BILA|nr:unnamed protein product [Brugia timori]
MSTLSTHLEVIQAADNLPETIVDNYSNEMSVSKEYTTIKACNSGSSKFTRF